MIDAPVQARHLLITEVNTRPTEQEFIEIHNPTSAAIDLSTYYLSDDASYPLLPGNSGAGPVTTVNATDWILRFPIGASIAPGQVIVVARLAPGFQIAFGMTPDYGFEDATGTSAMVVVVGEMTNMNITSGGEGLALFTWDGTTDLVTDVDLVIVATPFESIPDKTQLSVDGPDLGTSASQYLPDRSTLTMLEQVSLGTSYKRIAFEDGNEVQLGSGNGQLGHDETSEDLARTWDTKLTATAPTPGLLHTALAP